MAEYRFPEDIVNKEEWTKKDEKLAKINPELRNLCEKVEKKEKLYSKFEDAEKSAWEASSEIASLNELLPTDATIERCHSLGMTEEFYKQVTHDTDLELLDQFYHDRQARRKVVESGLHETLSPRARWDLQLDPASLDEMEIEFPREIDIPDPEPPEPNPPLSDRDLEIIQGDEELELLHGTVRHMAAMSSKLKDLDARKREALNSITPEYGKSEQSRGPKNYKDFPETTPKIQSKGLVRQRFETIIFETSARQKLAKNTLVHARREAWASPGWSMLSLRGQSYLSGPPSHGGGRGPGLDREA